MNELEKRISLIKPLRTIRTTKIFREIRREEQTVLIFEQEDD